MLAEAYYAIENEKLNLLRVASGSIEITYWYVQEAETLRTIRYSSQWHKQNWTDIE